MQLQNHNDYGLIRPFLKIAFKELSAINEGIEMAYAMDGSGECGDFIMQGYERDCVLAVQESASIFNLDIQYLTTILLKWIKVRYSIYQDEYIQICELLKVAKSLSLPSDWKDDEDFLTQLEQFMWLNGTHMRRTVNPADPTVVHEWDLRIGQFDVFLQAAFGASQFSIRKDGVTYTMKVVNDCVLARQEVTNFLTVAKQMVAQNSI